MPIWSQENWKCKAVVSRPVLKPELQDQAELCQESACYLQGTIAFYRSVVPLLCCPCGAIS